MDGLADSHALALFQALWAAGIADAVRRLRGRRLIVVCGHGWGGCLAELFVHRFFSFKRADQLDHPLLDLTTFGTPPTGSRRFVADLECSGLTDWDHRRFVLHSDTWVTEEVPPALVHGGHCCYIPARRPHPSQRNVDSRPYVVDPAPPVVLLDQLRSGWARLWSVVRDLPRRFPRGRSGAVAVSAADYARALEPR
jgi:hypothetical protein